MKKHENYKLKKLNFLSVKQIADDEVILKQFCIWFERPGVFLNQHIKAIDVCVDLDAGAGDIKSAHFLMAELQNSLLTADIQVTFEDGSTAIWTYTLSAAEGLRWVNSVCDDEDELPFSRKLFDNPNDALILYEETNTVINAYKVPIFKNIPPSIPCYVRGADGTDTLIYAMLDTGATRTLIDPYIAEKFGRLTGNKHSIKTMNGSAGDIDECELDVRFNSEALDDLGVILGSVTRFVYDPDGPAAYHNPAIVFGIDVIMEWNLLVKPGEQAIYIASRVGGCNGY
jgi:hypothetical protein